LLASVEISLFEWRETGRRRGERLRRQSKGSGTRLLAERTCGRGWSLAAAGSERGE